VIPAVATWRALGTGVTVVVTDAAGLAAASRAVQDELAAIDAACSRFRADAEIARLHAAGGAPVRVGALLLEAVSVALEAARRTGGLVDPTVGAAVAAAGYDRDFDDLPDDGPARPAAAVPGWRSVAIDRAASAVRLAPGTILDLGATAKALAADRAAAAAARAAAPHGVLVSLGGDLALAGPVPPGGWPVGIADDHGAQTADATVALTTGALATSSVTQRRWRRGGRTAHHLIDPRTGRPATVVWRTVSVAAPTCVEANIASTAAVVLGADAPAWLQERGLPARLVAGDGAVTGTCGWATPEPVAA
jgi:thiamine biosynthesis lipoprotein